ncbi:carboxymuconolactone decarboxylase family protein [Methanosphaera cuniculi]|uniref:Carboxymuconolactone decarboxylase family protein n=1 Tax=Methanosphaera cuniculi TaxID=1077256 RepID=A0A2A2HEX1_9EURY|nr:carboxymuconolactone decarboxylase family protein [Methanosphaera cuniculi]PAV07905.1 hypothetical protein ASJ82_06890 [Methanosphaera cuniculi]PWL08205.1 carboxymuconolactone decarboxylase family protein [Methanosphaera cuniculi]
MLDDNEIIEIISEYDLELKNTDPELVEIIDNLICVDLKDEYMKLSYDERMIVILTTLITNQSVDLYEKLLTQALRNGFKPVIIKEMLYQTIVYVGLSKVYEFIDITNDIFDENGVDVPLPGQSITTNKTRKNEGYTIQADHYGKDWLDMKIKSTPDNQKQLWDYISAFGFGDIYTRGGISQKQRELITLAVLVSLRGCEDQLEIHMRGNLKVGNDENKIIAVLMILIPYIGFPRIHNALKILNKITI